MVSLSSSEIRRKFFVLTALSFTALAPPHTSEHLWAQDTAFRLDPNQTQINFTTSDTVHTVRGTFKLKSGTIGYDPATGKASGQIVVETGSEDTGSGMRDRKVRKDVLESQRYPDIAFTPDRIDGSIPSAGDFQVAVHGTFHVHGGDHEMTLTVNGGHQNGGLSLSTDFVVPYRDWGMKNPSTFFIHVIDTVQMSVRTVARPGAEALSNGR